MGYGFSRMLNKPQSQVSKMSGSVPLLVRLGIYRVSKEKQETLLKLMVLSTAAILGKIS